MAENKIKVTLIKSTIGCLKDQKATVESLGLKKIRQSKVFDDSPALQGKLFKIKHLVKVENVSEVAHEIRKFTTCRRRKNF